jgi:hypothetical protein
MLRTLSHRLDGKLPAELDVQQSDYVATWSGDNKVSRQDPQVLRRLLMPAASRLPGGLLKILAHIWFNPSLRNRHTFQRWGGLDEE